MEGVDDREKILPSRSEALFTEVREMRRESGCGREVREGGTTGLRRDGDGWARASGHRFNICSGNVSK